MYVIYRTMGSEKTVVGEYQNRHDGEHWLFVFAYRPLPEYKTDWIKVKEIREDGQIVGATVMTSRGKLLATFYLEETNNG